MALHIRGRIEFFGFDIQTNLICHFNKSIFDLVSGKGLKFLVSILKQVSYGTLISSILIWFIVEGLNSLVLIIREITALSEAQSGHTGMSSQFGFRGFLLP